MAKIVLLAILSIDGYLAKKDNEIQWWLSPDKYDIAPIRKKADFIVSPETPFNFLKDEVKKKDEKVLLLEGEPGLVGLINKSLKHNLISEMIIYRVPLLAGGCHLLFIPQKASSLWEIKEKKVYDGNIERLVYRQME